MPRRRTAEIHAADLNLVFVRWSSPLAFFGRDDALLLA